MLRRSLSAVSAFVPAALLAAPLALAGAPQVQTGGFAPGERYEPPADGAPARTSRAFVKTVALKEGRAVVELPVTGGSRLIVWSAATSADASGKAAPLPLRSSLRLPTGASASPDTARDFAIPAEEAADLGLDLAGAQQALHVRSAEAGPHRLELLADRDGIVTLVAAEPESRLTLETSAGPLSRQPGQPLTLRAALRDGEAPITGARVLARLAAEGRTGGRPVELRDDGRSGDGAANDGVYGRVLRGLPAQPAGLWSARVEASGSDLSGRPFLRTGGSGFVNEPGDARLADGGVTARVVGDGPARVLRVTAVADVAVAGRYRLDAIVAGAPEADLSRPGRAWAESTLELAAGRQRLSLDVPLAGAPAGERLLADVRLLGLDRPGLAGRVAVEVK